MAQQRVALRRSLSLPVMTFYGLGTILGAGIYALVGKVVARAGMHAPLAFLCAAVIAALTAFSYAELSARLPRSAGEAAYVQAAFGRRWLTRGVGWGIVLTGLLSAAAMVNAFVGYLQVFVALPGPVVITGLVVLLGVITAVGVEASAGVAVIVTLIELSGLVLVLAIAGHHLSDLSARIGEIIPGRLEAGAGIFGGAFLAFYAFVGFEDMANMAEEVHAPERTMPRAIVSAMGMATLLYLLVAVVAVLALPIDRLAGSSAPLAEIVTADGRVGSEVISLISLFAIVNGALVQLIMVARVLYGMARTGDAPALLGHVHRRTRTPLLATAGGTATVLALALWLPLVPLAEITSSLILVLYAAVNVACVRLQRRSDLPWPVRVPVWLPYCGTVACLAMLVLRVISGAASGNAPG